MLLAPRMDAEGKPMVNIVRGKSYLRSYVVFPASAIANMPQLPAVEPPPKWEIRSQFEGLIEKMGRLPAKHEPGNRAFYSITNDSITMPERGQLKDSVDGTGQVTEAASDKVPVSVAARNVAFHGCKAPPCTPYERRAWKPLLQ